MKKGFTLVELLVVIAIIATLVALAVPNFLSARERARDSKRKSDLVQLKAALRLYYNDYNRYPSSTGALNSISGCGSDGTLPCPVCTSAQFAAGGTDGCSSLYMKQLPTSDNFYYYQCPGGDDFRLKSTLENKSDTDAASSQKRCVASCGLTSYITSDFVVCAD
jgi:type II secretion system protein G